jgi:hypothetical protein
MVSPGVESREQREDDREHGIGKLYPTPFKFNWFNEKGVFGSDTNPG